MKNDDEWTPAERHDLDALPREIAPPDGHEDRTVAALESRGLVRRGPRSVAWQHLLAAAAVAMVLFGGGAAAGRWSGERRIEPPHSPEFILLLRAGSETPPADAEEGMNRIQEYASWAQKARRQGLLTGEKLTDDSRFLGPGGIEASFDVEPEEHIQGYFLLQASSYEQAVAIASGCPHVKYGGAIEVRRIEPFTKETS